MSYLFVQAIIGLGTALSVGLVFVGAYSSYQPLVTDRSSPASAPSE